MDGEITIGEILKPQGLRGEIKVKPYTDDINRYKKLRAVLIDSVPFRISSLRIADQYVFMKLHGVESVDEAEKLRGKMVCIERIHARIDDDAFFIVDIVGSSLILDDEAVGKITDVLQHGAADVFEVALTSGKKMLFPFLNKLNLDVDLENKRISGKAKEIEKVAVYE